jgi:hypothetical protein
MAQANYKQIEKAIIARENFRGNSCRGAWECGAYRVYSYSTLIAESGADASLYFNERKYSLTTSRLQNIIRRSWGLK